MLLEPSRRWPAIFPDPRACSALASLRRLLSDWGRGQYVCCLAFSPDGSRLAVAEGRREITWRDGRTGAEIPALRRRVVDTQVWCIAFSPNGARMASGAQDGTVRLWDVATCTELALLKGHTGEILSMAFSADSERLFTASEDHTVRVWDVATGDEVLTLRGHTGMVRCLALSPDGEQPVTASADGTARIWDREPYAKRYAERQAALAAAHTARALVASLHARLHDWEKVAAAIPDLTANNHLVRQQAFNLILQYASAQVPGE